eukprot:403361518
MGNRTGCGIFQGPRYKEEKYSVKELNDEDNRTIKELYYEMKVFRKEINMSEFKRILNFSIQSMRKERKISQNLDYTYEYIQVIIEKDLTSTQKFRITMEEFYMLWQYAVKEKINDENGGSLTNQNPIIQRQYQNSRKSGGMCFECFVCPKRVKVGKSIMDEKTIQQLEYRQRQMISYSQPQDDSEDSQETESVQLDKSVDLDQQQLRYTNNSDKQKLEDDEYKFYQ